ncbi:MAG: Lrp/AsnC family transcriptional regulator [Candidatus Helarchaeota archaeon]
MHGRLFRKFTNDLNVSESNIRKRVNKLVKNGIIKNFTIVLNPEAMERSIMSFLTIIPKQSNKLVKEIANRIIDFPEVSEAYYMSSKYGLLVKVSVQNLSKLDEFIERIRNIQGINEIESCIVLKELKDEY